jgi:peroxiredoxin family protein
MQTGQNNDAIKKVSIIISRGSLDGIYPGLILANGARMEGIEANLFFTFFGMDAIVDKKMDHIKVATVGNPAMHMPTVLGAIPGISALATRMMSKEMEKLDIPPVREFMEMIHDSGCSIFACKASADMFRLKKEDFCRQVDDIITVGDFYNLSSGASIIFT